MTDKPSLVEEYLFPTSFYLFVKDFYQLLLSDDLAANLNIGRVRFAVHPLPLARGTLEAVSICSDLIYLQCRYGREQNGHIDRLHLHQEYMVPDSRSVEIHPQLPRRFR